MQPLQYEYMETPYADVTVDNANILGKAGWKLIGRVTKPGGGDTAMWERLDAASRERLLRASGQHDALQHIADITRAPLMTTVHPMIAPSLCQSCLQVYEIAMRAIKR